VGILRVAVRRGRAALGPVMVLAFVSTASAQYFSQNKVQSKTFEFKILKDGVFRHLLLRERATRSRSRSSNDRAMRPNH
jgi:hypothetical protein